MKHLLRDLHQVIYGGAIQTCRQQCITFNNPTDNRPKAGLAPFREVSYHHYWLNIYLNVFDQLIDDPDGVYAKEDI